MLETERLILRNWRPEDRPSFAAMNADPEVMDFPGPLDRRESDAEIDDFLRRWRLDGFCFAAIERREDGVFLGMAGIARCDMDLPFCPCVEIGWRLVRAHWDRGYATEAARGWLDHGFMTLGLDEIVAFTDVANRRSLAVMERLGMRRDTSRDFEHPALPTGHALRPHVLCSARRDDWAAG
ncbi:MAG TPA: GNAT family N-acetyltransferase [Amaricoccus sp.]|uniref:GNAT family N-acetyltransferase n=1 Tax=Amaricoccus sp. TaxID=1872485 RepID=UPI002C9949A2|nr:GNAT family N-acetyltransferase [Amaricoccus sp.]HMQ94164.1 GNAT family N-acetyltransferase [Amaricoccus sp.]HMR54560.1 GNAT family N-acetyltransferase [Amaricoccus sp.]HMR61358.1 GNAT family N-acetyltransferase [Amaricoccus sp.]HMU01613.1 GNAT family N-acetyltransferase [Amaricoccus sp.]